ncbi:MAG: hypothetical protein LQ342_008257 [Letrouitia transgressa]|nr:MAG: hypothetical protein LQ342_008257 [Letrouitia transgressa]
MDHQAVTASVQCRDLQIQQIVSLLEPDFPNPQTIAIHGVEATGKTLTVNAILESLDCPSAIIKSQECITTRHLLERALAATNASLAKYGASRDIDGRCESISAFAVQLQRLLNDTENFILVFDGIDRQREASPTLLPALIRLGELIPSLTTVLIITSPNARSLHHDGIPHIHFPPYTRSELLSIISSDPLSLPPSSSSLPGYSDPPSPLSFSEADTAYLFPRFAASVYDSLVHPASRSLPALRSACARLWPAFTAPILGGTYSPREFSKLMVRNRALFQSESALLVSLIPPSVSSNSSISQQDRYQQQQLLLPNLPAQLLVAAFLASTVAQKHDFLLFSKRTEARRKKRGGGAVMTPRKTKKNPTARKLSRQMLGPQPFVLERMLAIWHALFASAEEEDGARKAGGGAEVLGQFATLVGLRLVIRVGAGGDPLDVGAKWKINVGAQYVRGVSRGVGVDVDDYLIG